MDWFLYDRDLRHERVITKERDIFMTLLSTYDETLTYGWRLKANSNIFQKYFWIFETVLDQMFSVLLSIEDTILKLRDRWCDGMLKYTKKSSSSNNTDGKSKSGKTKYLRIYFKFHNI